jgi:transposase
MRIKQETIIVWLIGKLGKRLAKQVISLVLLAFGVSRKDIMEGLGVSANTLVKYDRALSNGALVCVLEPTLYKPTSKLDKYAAVIEEAIEDAKPQSRREIQDIIKEKTGIDISLNRIGSWLKKRG